jgi:hypothetical protein
MGVDAHIFEVIFEVNLQEATMARRIKDANLQSREARRKLKIRDRLYVRAIDKDVAIGYRRTKSGAGTWWMRIYLGAQKYRFEPIGVADDLSDSDGVAILDFWQAQVKVREAPRRATTKGPLTVADVIDDYVEYLEAHKKSAIDVRRRMDAHVSPVLGDIECSALTAERIHKWHLALARQPAMLRTARGAKRQYRKAVDDDGDNARARKVSANRVLAMLRAALNRAWRAGKISSDLAWRRVQPFKSVEIARQQGRGGAEVDQCVRSRFPCGRARCSRNWVQIRRANAAHRRRSQPASRHARNSTIEVWTIASCRADGRRSRLFRSSLRWTRRSRSDSSARRWIALEADTAIETNARSLRARSYLAGDSFPWAEAQLGIARCHGGNAADGCGAQSRPRRPANGARALRPSCVRLRRRRYPRPRAAVRHGRADQRADDKVLTMCKVIRSPRGLVSIEPGTMPERSAVALKIGAIGSAS